MLAASLKANRLYLFEAISDAENPANSLSDWSLCIYALALLGILSITGWIKPVGITWIDKTVAKAEVGAKDNWEYAGKWFGRSALIMLICFSVALFLFVFSSVVLNGIAKLSG